MTTTTPPEGKSYQLDQSASKPLSLDAGDPFVRNDVTNCGREIFGLSVIATALLLLAVQGVQSERIRSTWPMYWFNETFGDLSNALLISPPLFFLGIAIAWVTSRLRVRKRIRFISSQIALGLLLVALAKKIPFPTQPGAWSGFGLGPTLASLILALVLVTYPVFVPKADNKNFSGILKVIVLIAILMPYSLVYVQPPNGLINLGDTSYHVLDELLAPMLGSYPLSEYSPQYSGMLGWVLYPLKFFSLTGETTMIVVIIASNLFNLLIPMLVLFIVIGVFPTLPKLTTLAAFVVIWGVQGASRGESAQLREFANFGRYVPILFVVWIIVRMLNSSGASQQKLAIVAGLASAFTILGSPDYGLSFVAAFIFSLSIAVYKKWIASRIHFSFLFGLLLGIVSYCLILMLTGKAASLESWIGLRVRARSLYGGGEVEVLDPHLIVMAIAVTSIAFGFNGIRKSAITKQEVTFRISILSVGLWLLSLLARYLLAPGPIGLPPFFIPAFIAIALVVGQVRLNSCTKDKLLNRVQMLPLLLVVALPLAALWNFPEPKDEIKRISGRYVNTTNWSSTAGRVSDGWSPSALEKYDDFITNTSILAKRIQSNDSSIGYFGIYGHTIELLTGIDNVLGIPAPESLRFGSSQEELACVPIVSRKPRFVIVYSSSFPCSDYKLNMDYSMEKLFVYERVDHP